MLILASRSPRRRELLDLIAEDFRVIPSGFDEKTIALKDPIELVSALSRSKALSVAGLNDIPKNSIIIGCDTIVSLDGEIFGIPQTKEDAYSTLSALSGKTHSVITGVCLLQDSKEIAFQCETKVTFFELEASEILSYINTNEPYDKAGGYGIQGRGGLFVEKIEGDYTNVVGLPISRLYRYLKSYQRDI